ncbi:hypothetical protein NKG05_16205 [Oerskovia sp. M15]
MTSDLTSRAGRRAGARATAAVTAMALLALTACSADDEGPGGDVVGTEQTAGSMSGFAADEQFKATEPVDLSMLWTDWPDLPVEDSWELFDEIEKRTNVSIELTNIPFSDATEKRSLLISAGDAPYVIPSSTPARRRPSPPRAPCCR